MHLFSTSAQTVHFSSRVGTGMVKYLLLPKIQTILYIIPLYQEKLIGNLLEDRIGILGLHLLKFPPTHRKPNHNAKDRIYVVTTYAKLKPRLTW